MLKSSSRSKTVVLWSSWSSEGPLVSPALWGFRITYAAFYRGSWVVSTKCKDSTLTRSSTVTRDKITGSKRLNVFYVNMGFSMFSITRVIRITLYLLMYLNKECFQQGWAGSVNESPILTIYTSITNANRSLCKESNSSKRTILSFLQHKRHWWWISFYMSLFESKPYPKTLHYVVCCYVFSC